MIRMVTVLDTSSLPQNDVGNYSGLFMITTTLKQVQFEVDKEHIMVISNGSHGDTSEVT